MGFQDYKQYNYSGYTYCGGPFASQACGPCSVADIVEVSPITVAQWMTNNGFATTDGHGTMWGGINAALSAFGAGGKMLNGNSILGQTSSSYFNTWQSEIQSGKSGVLLMGAGTNTYWTGSGHYIAVVGYKNGQYLVHDPASTARTGYHSFSDFAGNIKILYTSTKLWTSGSGAVDTYTFTLKQVKEGDIGNAVLILQRILYSRGLYSKKSGLDGSFGPKTKDAVIKYQKHINAHGGKLAVDGVCGPATWTSLMGFTGSVNGANTTFTVKQVEAGDKNTYVLLAQEMLYALGLYVSVLDQNYGPATVQAVRDAQRKYGIAQDGICGPTTFKKLLGV